MTLRELSRYYNLQKRLARAEEMLESFITTSCLGAQVITGMPHASGTRDKVGDLAAEITDMQDKIKQLEREGRQAKREISAYIDTIQNDQTRMIFRLRFLRCMTWKEVAALVGGRNTASGVKMICYRYISEHKKL
ncbi:MAG: DUF1492 domain-containing protein [Oscillospiraceae bacterium]|nr:DUF1492 domain-containing protein [Oscillospiraceae bacterium]